MVRLLSFFIASFFFTAARFVFDVTAVSPHAAGAGGAGAGAGGGGGGGGDAAAAVEGGWRWRQ